MTARAQLADTRELPDGPWVVAVSGGMDSMALLWDLRFGDRESRPGTELVVAHLDHAMRPGSAADAAWLQGICTAWGLPLIRSTASPAPVSEEEARELRYAFLDGVRERTRSRAILTAHHADDQAETVLFRVLRGTGLSGLRGIPARRGSIYRPLLHRTRAEIARWAHERRVPYRVDPSNRSRRFARNRIRLDLIPGLEGLGLPRARRSLVRLARNAERAEAERQALERVAFDSVLRAPAGARREWSVAYVSEWSPPLRRRLIRRAASELGVAPSAASTESAVRAMDELGPGQGVDLSGGLRLTRGRGEWILQRVAVESWDEVWLDGAAPCEGVLRLGGRRFRYAWGPGHTSLEGGARTAPTLAFPTDRPLWLRGWRAGDRIRLAYGSKAVAKVLSERGVPSVDRPSTPLVAGPDGAVLWIPGAAAAESTRGPAGPDFFTLRCTADVHG